jgi:hypothetical protein
MQIVQHHELRQYVTERGWEVSAEYVDTASAGRWPAGRGSISFGRRRLVKVRSRAGLEAPTAGAAELRTACAASEGSPRSAPFL